MERIGLSEECKDLSLIIENLKTGKEKCDIGDEELDMDILVGDYLTTIEYDYPAFHLSMQCFWCQIVDGTPVLKEDEAARWLDLEHIDSVGWLPADQTIIELIKDKMLDQVAAEILQKHRQAFEELAK